jgi:LuxR family maltose regulon positive regulatory protein
MTEPVAVVLDHVETMDNRECLDAVAELAVRLPAGSQLLLASRHTAPLPVALLRARGHVVEVGADELAMDDQEARALLEGAGVQLTSEEVAELVKRTEGWPVGLYLAALARKAGSKQHHAGFGFTGDDRFMADYLQSELLAHLPPELMTFLTRTAVLERLSGPLCDAVLATSGSERVLSSLEDSNLLLWRWTASVTGTATISCSGSCSWLSWSGVSPSSSMACTPGQRSGMRPTGWRSWPSTMPKPPATPTRSPGWSPAW